METSRLTQGGLSAPLERRGERPTKAVWLALGLFLAGLLLILIGVVLHFTDPEAYGATPLSLSLLLTERPDFPPGDSI